MNSIEGVATSITAFVGAAARGPIDAPLHIGSFADYQRSFGGLALTSPMSFAVGQFFQNGGADAIIVRVHNGALTGEADLPLTGGGTAGFVAANPGSWASGLRLRVDLNVDADVIAANPASTMFNLQVKDLGTGSIELYPALSITPAHPRFATAVLAQSSALLRGPTTFASRPKANDAATGADPFVDPTATAMSVGTSNPDGATITAAQLYSAAGMQANQQGIYQLEKVDLFNLLVIPPCDFATDLSKADWDAVVAYAQGRRAIVLVDAPASWTTASAPTASGAVVGVASPSANAAMYFPRLNSINSLRDNDVDVFAPAGTVAGVIARTDAKYGVWKSPSGLEATLSGVLSPSIELNDLQNGAINPLGVNCIRSFPNASATVWGARTLMGADALASEWKYLAVRRTALFLEESLARGMRWIAVEPNGEPLWAQIRSSVGAFMQALFRQGAFQGDAPKDAYFVKCDSTTTTQSDIDSGIVNVSIGFAPLKPAEFVVIQLQQIAATSPPLD